jgi:hypothetical protein
MSGITDWRTGILSIAWITTYVMEAYCAASTDSGKCEAPQCLSALDLQHRLLSSGPLPCYLLSWVEWMATMVCSGYGPRASRVDLELW